MRAEWRRPILNITSSDVNGVVCCVCDDYKSVARIDFGVPIFSQ
jgi:hypothetical protein